MRVARHQGNASLADHAWLLPLSVAVATLPLYILTAAPTLSARNGGDDGGDLAVAASALSVAHPSGYPLYVMLGWLWMHLLTLGDVAYRLNLLSGVSAAAAAGATAWLALEVLALAGSGKVTWRVLAAACAASLLLGVSQPLWGQAVVISVYTLNAAFAAAALALIVRGQRLGPTLPRAVLLGMLLGAGLGNHLTLVFAVLAAVVVGLEQRWPLAIWLGAMLGLIAGAAAVYGYLLFGGVAARDPIGAWGDPSSLQGFASLVSGQLYHGLVGRPPAAQLAQRLLRTASLLVGVLTPVGLAAAVFGVVGVLQSERPSRGRCLLAPAVLGLSALLFALTYGGARGEHHLLLFYVALTPLAALGFHEALEYVAGPRAVCAGAAGLLAVVALAGWSARGASAAGDDSSVQAARQALRAQPPNGRLYPELDADTFTLWYLQQDLGERRDVAVIHRGLWQVSASYRAKLLASYPWLTAADVGA